MESATGVPDGDAARRELYDLLTGDLEFETAAERALALGREYLGVGHAHLARIDGATDYWEVVASTDGPAGRFPVGTVTPLAETFCRHVGLGEGTVAIHDAPAQGYGEDPAYLAEDLRCYHRTPVEVDGERYGTVCFVDDAKRPPFGPEETSFAELIAHLLGATLEGERQATELRRREDLITVLSRVLRHNLRNDMTVIRGQVSTIAERLEDAEERCEVVIDLSDNIIEMSEKARRLELIVSSEFDRERVDIAALVERQAAAVAESYPDASVSVTAPPSVTLTALPSAEMAVAELLENAAKHAGSDPTVTVRVEQSDEWVTVSVADDGPGLPEHERAVLDEGVETPLVHGSGLGLWVVYWIVTSHGGTVETSVEGGTTVTVSLPRTGGDVGAPVSPASRRFQRGYDRFRAVFEEAFDAMVIVNDDRRVVDANERAAALFDVSVESLLGRSLDSFAPTEGVPEGWPETGQDQGIVQVVDDAGGEHHVEFTVSADVVPGQHLVIGREVTERVARERRLEALRTGFPHLCFVLDREGVYHEVLSSPASAAGLFADPEELIGRTVESVFPPSTAERLMAALDRTIETGQPQRVTYSVDVPAGRRRFEARTHPLSIPVDSGDAVAVVARDVTRDAPEAGGTGEETGDDA